MKDVYFHLFLFFKLQWIGKLVIMVKLIQCWLIDWLIDVLCSLTFLWQIFNTYSGRERNSLIYKYYIEIQTWRIFTWQSLVSSVYRYIVGLHDKIYLYQDVLISSILSYYNGGYAQIYVYLLSIYDAGRQTLNKVCLWCCGHFNKIKTELTVRVLMY